MCMTPLVRKGRLIPCNKCPHCRGLRKNSWFVRLWNEMQNYPPNSTLMLDLTYDNDHLPKDGGLDKEECKRFFKRLREALKKKYHFRVPIKYFLAGEYGGQFGRPHYHVILFGMPEYNTKDTWQLIRDAWGNGNVDRKYVDSRAFRYVTKYCVKESSIHTNMKHFKIHYITKVYKNGRKVHTFNWWNPNTKSYISNNFVLSSSHLGDSYLTKQKIYDYGFSHKSTIHVNGVDYNLPRYYILKIRQIFPHFLKTKVKIVYPDSITPKEAVLLFCQNILKKDLDYSTFELEDVDDFLRWHFPTYYGCSSVLRRMMQSTFDNYKRPSKKYMYKGLAEILALFFLSHTSEFSETFELIPKSKFLDEKRQHFDRFHNKCIKDGCDERKAYFGHQFKGSYSDYHSYFDSHFGEFYPNLITNFW